MNKKRRDELADEFLIAGKSKVMAFPLWDGTLGTPPDEGVPMAWGVGFDHDTGAPIIDFVELVEAYSGWYRLTDVQRILVPMDPPAPRVPQRIKPPPTLERLRNFVRSFVGWSTARMAALRG